MTYIVDGFELRWEKQMMAEVGALQPKVYLEYNDQDLKTQETVFLIFFKENRISRVAGFKTEVDRSAFISIQLTNYFPLVFDTKKIKYNLLNKRDERLIDAFTISWAKNKLKRMEYLACSQYEENSNIEIFTVVYKRKRALAAHGFETAYDRDHYIATFLSNYKPIKTNAHN